MWESCLTDPEEAVSGRDGEPDGPELRPVRDADRSPEHRRGLGSFAEHIDRPTAEQVLAERFARGDLDEEEYHRRLDTLRRSGGAVSRH